MCYSCITWLKYRFWHSRSWDTATYIGEKTGSDWLSSTMVHVLFMQLHKECISREHLLMIILLGMVSPKVQSLDLNCSRYTLFLLEILLCAMDYNIKYIQTIMICTSLQDTGTLNRVMANIESCVLDIRSWMSTNVLKLNDLKTEFLLFGSCYGALVPCSYILIGNETSFPICISSEPWFHFWQWHDTWSTCLTVAWVQLSTTSRTFVV